MFRFTSVSGRNAPAHPIARLAAALLLSGLAVLSPLSPAAAHEFKIGDIEIEHPWSRATPPGARTGAGYLGLSNTGAAADRLVGTSSSVAGKVEVHLMSVEGGVMKMKPVEGGLEIPAGGRASLAPGGYHLMLMGLTKPLVEGEMVPVTLIFEKAGSVNVQLQVGPMGAKTSSSDAGGMDAHDGAH